MFNIKNIKNHSMSPKQIYGIISILALGTFGIAYASQTQLTDTSVTTTTLNAVNLILSGTCTGCGGGEGDFNSWTLLTNTTVTGVDADRITNILVNNQGSVLAETNTCFNEYMFSNGTVIASTNSHSNCFQSQTSISQSSQTGKYQVILDEDRTNNVYVYKNSILKDTKTIQKTQFLSNNLNSVAASISPDGKYIAIYGTDNGGTDQRLIVLRGS